MSSQGAALKYLIFEYKFVRPYNDDSPSVLHILLIVLHLKWTSPPPSLDAADKVWICSLELEGL